MRRELWESGGSTGSRCARTLGYGSSLASIEVLTSPLCGQPWEKRFPLVGFGFHVMRVVGCRSKCPSNLLRLLLTEFIAYVHDGRYSPLTLALVVTTLESAVLCRLPEMLVSK